MIDTTEVGGGSYPSPEEIKTQNIKGTITVTYDFSDDTFPINWNKEEIIDYIKDNYLEYLQELKKIEEIEI